MKSSLFCFIITLFIGNNIKAQKTMDSLEGNFIIPYEKYNLLFEKPLSKSIKLDGSFVIPDEIYNRLFEKPMSRSLKLEGSFIIPDEIYNLLFG